MPTRETGRRRFSGSDAIHVGREVHGRWIGLLLMLVPVGEPLAQDAPDGGATWSAPDAGADTPNLDGGAVPTPAAPSADAGAPAASRSDGRFQSVVGGSGPVSTLRRSSAPVTVVDLTQARRETADLGEVLARTEGVGIQRSGGLGSGTRLSLNGFTDNQVRILVDGVPIQASGFGLGTGSIPVEFLDRVEIYQGVVPIEFGADALGGAVNLVSRPHATGTGGSLSFQTGSFGTYRLTGGVHHTFGSSGVYLKGFGAFDQTDNDYIVTVPVADRSGRLREADVRRFHDGYRAESGGLEAGVGGKPWAEQWMLRLHGSRFDKEIQSNITMQVPYGSVESDTEAYGALMRYRNRFLGDRVLLQSTTGYGYHEVNFRDLGEYVYDWFGQKLSQRDGPGELSAGGSDRSTYQTTLYERLDARWTIAVGHAVELALSPTWTRRSGLERRLTPDTIDPLAIEREMTTFDSALAYHLKLFGRLENTLFVKGYLYRAHTIDTNTPGQAGVITDRSLGDFSVGYGDMLRLALPGKVAIKASYEHATRLPRPEELFGDNMFVKDNPDLRPETSHNVNLGLQYDSGVTWLGRLYGEATGFVRIAKGLIAMFGINDFALQYQNLVDATNAGVQGNFGWISPSRWIAIDGNATWMDFRNRSESGYFASFYDVRMPNQPYLFANANARFTVRGIFAGTDELALTAHLRYVHSFYRAWENIGIPDTKQQIPELVTFSAGLVYSVQTDRRRIVSTIEADNVTDARTFDFYGMQRPGRSVFWKGLVEFD